MEVGMLIIREVHSMIIRKAGPDQFNDIMNFYYDIIEDIGDSKDSAGWTRDVYPSADMVKDSIDKGELYLAMENSKIVGAMVLNHEYNDEYNNCDWPTKADADEISVIHILGVHPSYRRKGCAAKLVQFAMDHGRETGQKVIRLDVLKGNLIAEKMYPDMGFNYVMTLPVFYEDIGLKDFELYEYPL